MLLTSSTTPTIFFPMYNSTDKSYKRARAIKKGEFKLAPIHQEFVDRASKLLSINVLDFELETKETHKGYKQQVVGLIIDRIEDSERLRNNVSIQQVIAQRFIAYMSSTSEKERSSDTLKKDVWPLTINPYPEILVFFYPLERVEKSLAEIKIKDEWVKTLETFPEFWTLSQDVIFLQTDEQLQNCKAIGLEDKLINAYLQLIKKHDEFGYLGAHSVSLRFDSKESFDRNYNGNWYYYWK